MSIQGACLFAVLAMTCIIESGCRDDTTFAALAVDIDRSRVGGVDVEALNPLFELEVPDERIWSFRMRLTMGVAAFGPPVCRHIDDLAVDPGGNFFVRWPAGFICPGCGHDGGWRVGDGRFMCSGCGYRTSITAGTIFDRTRTPLTVWFTACWMFTTAKDGVSALSLKRVLEIGSYQTAWAMLHRIRSVLVRPGRERLTGTVAVDETYIGGEEPGLSGGRATGKKVLTGIAVEVREPKGLGRCRMAPLTDASAASLHPFVTDHVEPGTRVITDGWNGYLGLAKLGYTHDRRSQRAARARGDDPNELLPAVHRVASLTKRWLLGTHQGSVDDAHLASYLNEFVFRFNRRTSRSRGMVFYRVLELAVANDPVRYRDLIARRRPRAEPPVPPQGRGHPPSLERPPANRPWRRPDMRDSG